MSDISALPKVLISGNWYALQDGALIGGPINEDGTLALEDAVDIDRSRIEGDLRWEVDVAERALAQPVRFLAAMAGVNEELVSRRSRGDGGAMDVERWECLLDPQRHAEAMEMLEDMHSRLFVAAEVIAAAKAALYARDQPPPYGTEQRAYIEERILAIVNEVGEHAVSQTPFYPGGKVPPKLIASFGQLHDYCDANCLGGLCDDAVTARGNALFPTRTDEDTVATQGWMDACNEIQSAAGEWLSAHRLDASTALWIPLTSLAVGDYRSAFPEFGELDLAVPPGWYDHSYHNDTCPRFQRGFYTLWIEHREPALREPVGSPRFTLQINGIDGEYLDDLHATDDWTEMLAFIGRLPPSAEHPTHNGRTPHRLAQACGKVARLRCTVLSDSSQTWDVVVDERGEPQQRMVFACPNRQAAERLLWALCGESLGVAQGASLQVSN